MKRFLTYALTAVQCRPELLGEPRFLNLQHYILHNGQASTSIITLQSQWSKLTRYSFSALNYQKHFTFNYGNSMHL